MQRVILVHGIGANRCEDWWRPWADRIANLLGRPISPRPVTWEPLSDYHSYSQARYSDLIGDLRAVLDSEIAHYVRTTIADAMRVFDETWIVSHSMGSVLAYQAMVDLACDGIGYVHRFITMGSPLWLERRRILPPIRKPRNVERWINIQGRFDPVSRFGICSDLDGAENLKTWCRHPSEFYLESDGFRTAVTT